MKNIKGLLFAILIVLCYSCKKESEQYAKVLVYNSVIKYSNYNEPNNLHYYVTKLESGEFVYTTHSYYNEKDIETQLDKYPWIKVPKFNIETFKDIYLIDSIRINRNQIKY